MNKQISILGCGWLGFSLAQQLIKNGYSINGSTTSPEKIKILENAKINPFVISLTAKSIIGNFEKFLLNSSILIIDIPPQLRRNETESFVQKIKNSIPIIENSAIEKLIFISSTSVYGDVECSEKNPNLVNEKTICLPNTESGSQLLQVESLLLNNKNFLSTIIRFGGLVGDDRNPIKYLSGKINIENPDAPINFIHKDDCIAIIEKIIETNSWNEIFNGVNPNHPTRKDYYNSKALEYNLTPPEFEFNKSSSGKLVSSEKLETVLNYKFKKDI